MGPNPTATRLGLQSEIPARPVFLGSAGAEGRPARGAHPNATAEYRARNALVSSLKENSEAGDMPVLELVTSSEARQEEAGNESWQLVPWPCRTGDLERWIQAACLRYYEPTDERIENAT
jgi:hypothetical protein